MASRKDRFPCTGVGGCKLRYLKFKCQDEPGTIEFYQTLGMTLDGRSNFGKYHYSFRLTYRTSSVEFNENSLALLFEVQRNLGSGDIPPPSMSPPAGMVGDAAAAAAGDPNAAASAAPVLFDRTCPRDYLVIYVHFLPRVIKRLHSKGFKPLLGLQAYMSIQYAMFLDPNGIEIRLMEMPDVYLNEVTNKTQWFARLGYYVAQVGNGDDMRHYMESIFSKQRRTQAMVRAMQTTATAGSSGDPTGVSGGGGTSSLLAMGISGPLGSTGDGNSGNGGNGAPSMMGYLKLTQAPNTQTVGGKKATATDRFYQRDGLRLVDQEDVATGLQQTRYFWFGQVPREKMGTVCFTERSGAWDRGGGGGGGGWRGMAGNGVAMAAAGGLVSATAGPRRNHRLIAIGIEVGCTLDSALAQVMKEAPETWIVSDERWRVQDVGYIARARGLFDFQFEICSVHEPAPGEPTLLKLGAHTGGAANRRGFKGGAGRDQGGATTLSLRTPGSPVPVNPYAGRGDPFINFNQALRSVLSESALCRPLLDASAAEAAASPQSPGPGPNGSWNGRGGANPSPAPLGSPKRGGSAAPARKRRNSF
ncbi:hypothetical protein H9P43_007878 [Blastocladiella emersonii ATCC 22665]|nr:hypothetical protein H9P43_007878 [Blastocladiella emersonii ATCC 22665]